MAKNDKNSTVDDTDTVDPHIPATDEVTAIPKPDNIGETWKEKEYDKAAEEQIPLHEAEGIEEAADADVTIGETGRARETEEKRLAKAEEHNLDLEDNYQDESTKLLRFQNRPANAKRLYWIRLILLLLGDVAGIAGASLLIGETQFNAYGQALSAAAAAITLGAIGSETKRQVQRRGRADLWEDLDETYEPYRHFFVGRTDAEGLIRLVTATAILGLAIIAFAIYSLRDNTEGGAAGLTFGLLAAAVGLGSYINSFTTTCDVSEFLDARKILLSASRKYLEACRDSKVIKDHDGALVASRVIKEKWAAKGKAAYLARLRQKFGSLSANPIIVGHGEAATPISAARITAVPDSEEEAA